LNASLITLHGDQSPLFVPQVTTPDVLESANCQNLGALLTVAEREFFKKFAALRTPITGTREVLILNKIAGISGHTQNFSAHDTGTVHSSRLPIPRFGTQIACEPITTQYFQGKPR